MDSAQKIAAVEKYITAVSTANIDLIKEIFADNGTVEDPVGSEPKEGIAAIVAFYESFSSMGVKLALTGPVRCAGNAAAFPFTATIGDNVLEIIDVFEFDGAGKVVSMKAYWGA